MKRPRPELGCCATEKEKLLGKKRLSLESYSREAVGRGPLGVWRGECKEGKSSSVFGVYLAAERLPKISARMAHVASF
jgi:hypothetical protein